MRSPDPLAFTLLAALLLAQAGGPPTTLVTPGAATGREQRTPPAGAAQDRPAPSAPRVPAGSPGQAQRPTPDQSR